MNQSKYSALLQKSTDEKKKSKSQEKEKDLLAYFDQQLDKQDLETSFQTVKFSSEIMDILSSPKDKLNERFSKFIYTKSVIRRHV